MSIKRKNSLFIPLCLCITSFSGLYFPSSLFAFPNSLTRGKTLLGAEKFIIFYSIFLLIISFAIAQSLSVNLLKSFLILLSLPFSFMAGRLIDLHFSETKSAIFNPLTDILFSLILIPSIFLTVLAYEPSNMARVMIFISLILPIKKIFTSSRSSLNILMFKVSYLVSLLYTLSTGSLTIVASLLFSFSAASIAFLAKEIFDIFISFRARKKDLILFTLSILLVALTWLFFNLGLHTIFIDPRRLRNLESIFLFIRSFNIELFFSLSGGRFLSSYEGYIQFINAPFDISSIGQDLPSISSNSAYYDFLLSYSGLPEEFLSSRRPNSFVSWLVFNFRFLSIPIFLIIIYRIFVIAKSILLEKGAKFFSGFFALFMVIYFAFLAAPPSFSPVWIFIGLSYYQSKKSVRRDFS